MIHGLNLLPPSRRLALEREALAASLYRLVLRLRFGVLTVSCIALLAIAGLRASLVFLKEDTIGLEKAVEDYSKIRQSVLGQKTALDTLSRVSHESIAWSDLLSDMLRSVPAGFIIERMSASIIPRPLLTVSGTAPNRSSLIAFTDRLKIFPWVVSVDSPHSNFIERVNPSFTLSIAINISDKESEQ